MIDDPDNFLNGELADLTKEELMERLLVAEKVMKSLFQRNKELEDRAQAQPQTTGGNES